MIASKLAPTELADGRLGIRTKMSGLDLADMPFVGASLLAMGRIGAGSRGRRYGFRRWCSLHGMDCSAYIAIPIGALSGASQPLAGMYFSRG